MGSGASRDNEVVQNVTHDRAGSVTDRSKSGLSQSQKDRMSRHSDRQSPTKRQGQKLSRVEGYNSRIIKITKDGFTCTDVTAMEGQVVTFVWDETCSPVMSVFQVVSDGETLRPVVGGFSFAPPDQKREYEQLFNLAGEYKFAINTIRSTPLTVVVTVRDDLHADVKDDGFVPAVIQIDQGHSVVWSWKACEVPHTVNEVIYMVDKGCFHRQHNKKNSMLSTVTGKHRQQFKTPGTYYFRTESSELGKYHLCVVYVRTVAREHKIEVLDRTFSPMILLIDEGDKVWWNWDKNKCQKLHHIYQIDAPKEGHKQDSTYEPTIDGFKWHHNPSLQGLMCHQFRQAGVYHFSDLNFDEAAYYIGTIIVKPKPKVHHIQVKTSSFSPDVLYAQTGDYIVWSWDGEAAVKAGQNVLIQEEDKVLSPEYEAAAPLADEEMNLLKIDNDAMKLMTRSGHATICLTNIGLYTYRLSDGGDICCSVVVNPGPKNHTIHLTDTGVEPKALKIRPNDRVWWVWQSGKKQHNIRQVSHEGILTQDRFSSGLPRDSPSAFHHQFLSPGVFYFESQGLPKIYGAIVVCTQPQVHIVTVGREISPNPVTVQMFDVICWVFKKAVRNGTVEVESVDKILDASFEDVSISKRCCLGEAVKKLGLTHYYSKSFQREGKHTNNSAMTEEMKLSSAVCDERSDFSVIRVASKRGFRPNEIFLKKGKTVMFSWRGSSEQHNIIHVTDPKSNTPLNSVTGSKAFNSGKPVENSCFVHTFDESGDYPVASQGAPGYSCVVHIRDEVVQTLEPYNTSEKKGGSVDRYYKVDLQTDTEGADIYYTIDGSLPAPQFYTTKHYNKEKGIILKDPGLCFVRAYAAKDGQVYSHVFTSKCYWVLSGDGESNVSVDENSGSIDTKDKLELSSWDWWSCKPIIKGCFTGPGIVNVFWDLPETEAAQQQIKGYQIFLNGVSYCNMFPMANNSVHVQGLAGGRNYRITVVAYPKDANNVEITSNSLNLTCPTVVDGEGPLISLLKSDKPDSLTIIWMSIDKPDVTVTGYEICLNDQHCGSTLVPDSDCKRCKVLISSCQLNTKYKIHVKALVQNSSKNLLSNVLEVFLPLDTSYFKYPVVDQMQNDEDLYMEYIQVAEGSGYLSEMDDPDNPIWETETDKSSATSNENRSKKRRRKKKKTTVLGIAQLNLNSDESHLIAPFGEPVPGSNSVLLDKHRIYYDATKDETKYANNDNTHAMRIGGDKVGKVGKPKGSVIIEVEKAVTKNNEVLITGESTINEVSRERALMVRVEEGEYVSGSSDALLPCPSIMAESLGKDGLKVVWKMDKPEHAQYKIQLFVVNVVGTKFSGDVSSDISFDCKMVDKDKSIQGVQHCWNIQMNPGKSQQECQVIGLLPEVTYRIYIVANYVMVKGNEPCEAQATSSVLYYTIQGPPPSPNLIISKVHLYSVSVEWEGPPELVTEQNLKGYLIFVNGKPLGGRRSPDVREMIIENLVPGKTISLFVKAVSDFAEQESHPTRTVHITCPHRPPAPVISQEPSFKQGCVLVSWNKPVGQTYTSNREAISHYSIYIDDKWHGEVRANKLSDLQGYQFYLTDLLSEQGYDIAVKAVAGERTVDPDAQHVYCLSESSSSNIVPVMAPAAPRSPKLRLEGLNPEGVDITWQVPQQCGDAVISGYQMLRNGKLYGSVIPAEVTSLHISDIALGEKIELQLIALTEHAVGKGDRKVDIEKDSGKGSSQQGDKAESSHKIHTSNANTCLIEFKGIEEFIDYSDWPTILKDMNAGERYTGCKPGPKLIVHYTGLVSAPSEVWCEKVTGYSALIVWKKASNTRAHFLQPDNYQVTWWPGDRPQDEIQSDSTIEDHLMISGLRPCTTYTVVVEARKIEKYKDLDEGAYVAETPDGMNAFILSSKSKQIVVTTSRPPDPPSNVGVVAMTCHSLKVGWDPPREHGSDIIGIRVECVSLDPNKYHHVAVDILPDCTIAEVAGLNEKTDYCITIIAVTEEYFYHLPEKHHYKQLHGFPLNVLVSQEDSLWLPNTCIITRTSGTEPATDIQIVKATMDSLTLSWTPPLVYGSNKITGQIVRWSDVKKSRHAGHEELQIASHISLLPTEDTLTIDDLCPGAQYKVIVEAVVSVKTTLEPDSRDGSNIERYRRTTHVMSKPFYARTRAPVEPSKVIVMSYTQNSAILYWEKPPLMSMVGKNEDGGPRYLRRYLQGYKLEINGKLQSCLAPDVNSCTLTKCKPGRTYNVVLVAMTSTEEGNQKNKDYRTRIDNQEIDYMTLLQDDEHLDESPSESVQVTLPRDQDGYLASLEAKFHHNPSNDNKSLGEIELLWTVQGKTNLLKQFNIVWYCMDDRLIQTKCVGPGHRRATISVNKSKLIYTIKVEPTYYTDVLSQHAQEVQVIIPGPPDPPHIFIKSKERDEFCIEWGEPKLYGGVKVKGYQLYLNDKKAGFELNANHNKATIPYRSNKTCRVNVVALSDLPGYKDSQKSNTLVVSPANQSESTALMDDSLSSQDTGIPVTVAMVTENTIHIDWSSFLKTEDVAHYKLQWNSIAQPEPREVKLSERDCSCVINKCLPGTTHFVRLVAYSVNGQILDKSKQLTVQTCAPPEAPQPSVRACNFNYIAVQWEKPNTYGDALITGYKVYVNGIVEAVLNTDQLSYTYTQGKPCQEYVFQIQALSTDDNMNSKTSEPLVVIWPGSKAPILKQLPSISSSTVRVGWENPYLTDGLKIKHFMLYCKEDGSDKIMQTLGPLHASAREGEFHNLKKGSYSVYLDVHVYGSESTIRSEVMHLQPSLSPEPPQITVTLVGLEERRLLEKFVCDLVNKRDRLIRHVGHKLKKIGALSHPLRAEKNEDVIAGAQQLTRIEELLEDCFNVLESYTGQLTAHVSWQCVQTSSDVQLAGFKLLVDGKQYGSVIHAGMRTVRVQLGLEQPSYHLSMVAISEKPQGVSAESNVVEALSTHFKPFTFYCYHIIHKKETKYPSYGCCKYQDSIRYERQCAKKLANQGLLQKEIAPPVCSLLDVFDGEYKPLMSHHSHHCPSAILFWTPWCLSSQKLMDQFVRFAKENIKQLSCLAVACGLSKVTSEMRTSLAHTITSNSWREDHTVWHTTSNCFLGTKNGQETGKEKLMDIADHLGIAGVPTLLFINPEGNIIWHGRYCAFDYTIFESFMRHALAEVTRQPCPVINCDCCKGDTTLNEDALSQYVANMLSSGDSHSTSRSLLHYNNWSPRSLKFASWDGPRGNISAAEYLHSTRKKKSGNPGHKTRNSITVNKRPYSASGMMGLLDKSPYTTCVAPHLHLPHKIKPRPMSAKHYYASYPTS